MCALPTLGSVVRLNEKRTSNFSAVPATVLDPVTLRSARINFQRELPAQDLRCYLDYRIDGLQVMAFDGLHLRLELPACATLTPLLMLHQAWPRTYSECIFLVERGNWFGALAAIAYQPVADRHTATVHRICE